MNIQMLYLDHWKKRPLAEKDAMAKELVTTLPEGWQYTGIEHFALGGQENDIACFTWQGKKFVLVPGNQQAVLGYDSQNPFVMNEAQLEDWWGGWKAEMLEDLQEQEIEDMDEDEYAEYMAEYEEYTETYEHFLEKNVSVLRTVAVEPFLMETTPFKGEGLEQISVYQPAELDVSPPTKPGISVDAFQMARLAFKTNSSFEEGKYYAVPQQDKSVIVYQVMPRQGRTATMRAWAKDGFRLPTTDEWEYACAAGTRTLWRWGDEYPVDQDPQKYQREIYHDDLWMKHTLPNAFGLIMPDDPYNWEDTTNPGEYRGGDGGGRYCGGGLNIFEHWITLSSFYHQRGKYLHEAHFHPEMLGDDLRRIFPLEKRVQA